MKTDQCCGVIAIIKRCWDCGHSKRVTEFSPHSKRRDGLSDRCRDCTRAYTAAYRARHRDALLETKRRYYEENKAKCNSNSAEWAKKNPERRREISQKSAALYIDRKREQNKVYKKTNPEKTRQHANDRYARDPEAARARAREWRQLNLDKARAQGRAHAGIRRGRELQATPSWGDPAARQATT
jgi:hypothetical protein